MKEVILNELKTGRRSKLYPVLGSIPGQVERSRSVEPEKASPSTKDWKSGLGFAWND